MKSFQIPVTCRIVATIRIGVDIGSTIWQKNRQEAAAVDPGGVEQFLRQRRVVVAEQERHDRQAEDDVDDHDPGQRVVDAEHREQPDQRVQENLVGNEGADQQDREQQIGAAHPPERERVAVQRAGQDREDHGRDQDPDRIPEADADAIAAQPGAGLGPGRDPGLEGDRGRKGEDVAEPDLVHGLQGGQQHDPERQQEEQRRDDQEGVDADPAPGDVARPAARGPGGGHAARRFAPGPYWA